MSAPENVPPVTPHLAAATERGANASTLAEALLDDPVYSWLLPDEQVRLRRLARWFDMRLRLSYLPVGVVWTVEGNRGAALWQRPRRPGEPIRFGPALRSIPGELSTWGFSSLRKSLANAGGPQSPREPHWYLGALGVRVSAQGKGVGSALLRPVLNQCDASGTPAYLVASKESELGFYTRHGFEVMERVVVQQAGIPIWTMWRNPRTP